MSPDDVFFAEWRARGQGERRSLARARRLLDLLGAPTASAPVLTVVGSKGKGTTATYASAYLAAAGLRVVSVTSPALRANRERVRVNGTAISDASLSALAARISKALGSMPDRRESPGYLSPVGLFTIAGILHARDIEADVIVLEAGMGGASDEVSLFPPHTVAITEIFAEHVGVLGDTPAEIAREKAAVTSARTQAVLSLPQQPAVHQAITTVLRDRTTRPGKTTRLSTGTALRRDTEPTNDSTDTEASSPSKTEPMEVPEAEAAKAAEVEAGRVDLETVDLETVDLETVDLETVDLETVDLETVSAEGGTLPPDLLPPSYGRRNAVLGCAAAARMLSLLNLPLPPPKTLTDVLASVRLPGRLSFHTLPESGTKLCVDSAINRAGVATALTMALRHWPRVDHVLLCLPDHKDIEGAVTELAGLPVTFVRLALPHLRFTAPLPATWTAIDESQLTRRLLTELGPHVLAIGTVYFTGKVLDTINAPTETLFTPPPQPPAPSPQAPPPPP
ncbi:hypothetical protein [Sphaerisporangium krabiense]|uniref:Dihydrofolate synthase/folylpolyglutamate synthase n=1 Tax=Sphaerisporangium krabiense TaxID=763782 RepID=A0A7W8Z9H4_9ACTN|nr:hypothetical protein [Sphaerisporangium krabiense]MBB5629967.1 dihydrofolate synthase/folylpolyglutamate synthase [Sphaerisporangium krabiense]